MTETLVADTGVLYAALDPRDDEHGRCSTLLRSSRALVVPAPVVGELDWLGRSRGQAATAPIFLGSVVDGSVLVYDLDLEDWARTRGLLFQYADLPLSLVDASVIAAAERLEQTAIATLDHRHFSVVRPRHVRSFELLPD